jgi:hypothetical protein
MALLQKGYLGATPLFRTTNWFDVGLPSAINYASATLTANASAHTKGSWGQLIASTSTNFSFLIVRVSSISSAGINSASLVDLALGASGSEVAFASNIAVGGASGVGAAGLQSIVFGIPVQIPSGSRISARMQSVITGGKTGVIEILTCTTSDYETTLTDVDVIGADTSLSKGISFSGAANTWNEAVASTSRNYRAVILVPSSHDNALFNFNGASMTVGVGASGSEVEIGSLAYNINADERIGIAVGWPFFITKGSLVFSSNIPAGSRLAVRHPFSSGPEKVGFVLIGVP